MSDSCVLPSGWKGKADTIHIHDEKCGNTRCSSPERLLFTKKLDVVERKCLYVIGNAFRNAEIHWFSIRLFSIWHWFHFAFGYSFLDMDDWAWLSSNSSLVRYFGWFSFPSTLIFMKEFNCSSEQQETYYFTMIVIVIIDNKVIDWQKKTLSMKWKSHVKFSFTEQDEQFASLCFITISMSE